MGKETMIMKIRSLISNYAWIIFLWSIEMDEDNYWKSVYEQEKQRIEHPEDFVTPIQGK